MAYSTSQTRVTEELNKWMEKLEKESFRGLQAKSYKCAARCCENPTGSRAEVQQCLNKCFVPIQQIQEYQGKELQGLQDRLHRCAKQCEDNIRDSVGPNTTQAEITKYQAQVESCVDQCCLSHLELVPKMFERMKTVMSQVQEPNIT